VNPATKVRQVSEQEFPGTLPLEEQLRFLLRYAVLAPSARNAQPWRFEVDGATVRLYADPARWQPVADPAQRELYLGLGCALENLLVAAEHFGFGTSVTYLPDPGDPGLAAAVAFGPGGTPAAARAGLGPATLLARRTAHGVFADRPIRVSELRALERAAEDDEIVVRFTEVPGRRHAVEELHARAAGILMECPEYRRELGDVIGSGDLGTPWPLSRLGRLAASSARIAHRLEELELAALRSSPVLALIAARDDDHRSHLRSGQVLERVWLAATRLGLGVQPASAALEVPETRAELVPVFDLPPGLVAQELVRIGWPAGPWGFRTPRHPVEEVARG
jgi:nitroreductase